MITASSSPRPLELLGARLGQPGSVFLDSPTGGDCLLANEPFVIVRAKGRSIEIVRPQHTQKLQGNVFDVLAELLAQQPNGPGAAIGYFGYDLKNLLEALPATALDDLGLPDCWFGFYEKVDRFPAPMPVDLVDLSQPVRSTTALPADLQSNFTRDQYCQAVTRAKAYIAAGDIYQVNLSQRFQTRIAVDPWVAYQALRRANPAPYAAYLDLGEAQVLCSSPECFLRIDGRRIVTRPIKGTLPRHLDPELLRRSAKDNAELLMITDLERNDLGRVCEFGSVHVPSLVAVESYATVHHLVATVAGQLRPGISHLQALRACFPGGSITGAPKIRAMQIIDELEPHARGVYTGAIGYFGFNGISDFNIAIRTAIHQNGRLTFHAGGGIVADSEPAAEYDETLAKAEGIIRALDQLRLRQRPLPACDPSPSQH